MTYMAIQHSTQGDWLATKSLHLLMLESIFNECLGWHGIWPVVQEHNR